MNLFGHHHHQCDNPLEGASPLQVESYFMLVHIIERLETMATQAQIDKLSTDVTALLAAVNASSTATPDPKIDDLDAQVVAATTKLTTPPATP